MENKIKKFGGVRGRNFMLIWLKFNYRIFMGLKIKKKKLIKSKKRLNRINNFKKSFIWNYTISPIEGQD